jgi:hypothetical protein
MPYEHDAGQPPKPAAWTQHPLASDAAWAGLTGLMFVTLVRNGGPTWLLVVYAVFLLTLVFVSARRELARRAAHQ